MYQKKTNQKVTPRLDRFYALSSMEMSAILLYISFVITSYRFYDSQDDLLSMRSLGNISNSLTTYHNKNMDEAVDIDDEVAVGRMCKIIHNGDEKLKEWKGWFKTQEQKHRR